VELAFLAMRNALRSPTRTGLTLLTVMFGTLLLTASAAWLHGVFDETLARAAEPLGHVRIVTEEYDRRESLYPLYAAIEDSTTLAEQIRQQPGVAAVVERITQPVTVTTDETLGDEVAMAVGAPREWAIERLKLDEALVDGAIPEDGRGFVVGAVTAERVGARVGGELVLVGQTVDGAISPIKGEVVGIVRAGNPVVDRSVFVDLEKMRYLADLPDSATEILVYGATRDDDLAVARTLAEAGLTEHQIQPWTQRSPWAELVSMTAFIKNILSLVIVLVTALGVWNTMMMSVLERKAEIGVLRAMGLTRIGVMALFVGEALVVAVLGGAVGVALGSGIGLYMQANGIELSTDITQNAGLPIATTIRASLTPGMAVRAFLLGIGMAILGAGPPALRAAMVPPVEALRSD
jgi:putative ABC transport system permease protein